LIKALILRRRFLSQGSIIKAPQKKKIVMRNITEKIEESIMAITRLSTVGRLRKGLIILRQKMRKQSRKIVERTKIAKILERTRIILSLLLR